MARQAVTGKYNLREIEFDHAGGIECWELTDYLDQGMVGLLLQAV